MNTALMVLCHRPPYYVAALAQRHPQLQIYIHYDAKADIAELAWLQHLTNVHLLTQRIPIHWAGFSLVNATLALMQTALTHTNNQYFHLISADCVLLQSPMLIEAEFAQQKPGTLYLDHQLSNRLRYRVRFNTPHANTHWQRHPAGKLLTKCLQVADYLWPAPPVASGSQWFSADRHALHTLLNAATDEVQQYFRHKLCPDEHFFQYLLHKLPTTLHHINDNRRYIHFHHHHNHPQWLDLAQLHNLSHSQNWFARKVHTDTALVFLDQCS